MLPLRITAKWINGTYDLAPDAYSHFSGDQSYLEDESCEDNVEAPVETQFDDKSTHDIQVNEVSEHKKKDTHLFQVIEYVQSGRPNTLKEITVVAKSFWSIQQNLYVAFLKKDLILLMAERTVIYFCRRRCYKVSMRDIKALIKFVTEPVIPSTDLE